jgi:hypothetical protein
MPAACSKSHGIGRPSGAPPTAAFARSRAPAASASDWLFPEEALTPEPSVEGSRLSLTVPAGAVRIVDLRDR